MPDLRKKCDEAQPQCARCVQSRDRCIWSEAPTRKSKAPDASRSSSSSRDSPGEGHFANHAINLHYNACPDASTSPGIDSTSLDVFMDSLPPAEVTNIYTISTTGSAYEPGHALPQTSTVAHETSWQLVSHRPRTYLPPSDSRYVDCWKSTFSKPYTYRDLDQDDDDEEYEIRDWVPSARKSLSLVLEESGNLHILEMCDSWILFISRNCFDPSRVFSNLSKEIFQRYMKSDSVRHGMLSTAALIQGYYDPKTPPALMFEQAQKLAAIADQLTNLDMQRPEVSFEDKLAGLSELACYYYYSGNFKKYYNYLQLSAPIVSMLVGSNIEFHKLRGEANFDIAFFAWCDVLGAVARSSPTLLTYVCDVEPLLEGRESGPGDAGLEWIVGCPDAFTMLMVQIIKLRHNRITQAEKVAQAVRIEEIARAWIIRPTRASNPILRVERMAAQEIWRHGIILYLYNEIHRASPADETVQKSVKQIISLSSTMRPGRNPDCLLPVPYFIAATFAITPKDRHLLRTRVAGVGSEAFVDSLVRTLDDLWKEAGETRKRIDWAKKQPPTFIF